MARVSGRRPAVKSPHTRKQLEILKALEGAAKRQGLKVSASAGQLRFAGLKLKGGSCFLRGRQWLILDKSQPFDDLVELYRQVLPTEELVECGLPPDLLSAEARRAGEGLAAADVAHDGGRAA